MLRSGQFENLRWDKLAEAHTANWGLLQSKYGLSSQRIIPTASLSELAVKSVQNCRTYLFTDGAKCRNGWQTDGLPGILSAKDLEENLTPALCNHLLITFAYRFLCDNLTPRTLPECLNTIYSCLNDSLRIKYKYEKKEKDKVTGEEKANLVEDKDGTRELKSTFMKPKEQSCRAYDKKINAVFSCYKQQMQDLCRSLSEDQFAGIKRNKWIVRCLCLYQLERKKHTHHMTFAFMIMQFPLNWWMKSVRIVSLSHYARPVMDRIISVQEISIYMMNQPVF